MRRETKKSVSSNPFGLNFKGNVIQADVFETSRKTTGGIAENVREKLANSGKVLKSTVVGGINSFNESLKQKAGGIVAFGRKAKENISKAIDFMNNYDLGAVVQNKLKGAYEAVANRNQYSVKNLTKKPVSELKSMLITELTPLEVK